MSTNKPGRNDPCPCGSGKKYKKCCLAKTAPTQPESPGPPPGLDLHPYAITKIIENPSPQVQASLSSRDRAALKKKWTPGKLAGMETDAIVTRLGELGIDGGRAGFMPLTAGHTAAWSIGERWLAGLQRPPDMQDEDFVCLAACELWKRYSPERPSDEMVDDWVSEGYDYLEANNNSEAADTWLPVWETVMPKLRPDMRTFRAVDPLFKISQFFGNWIQDFEMALENAARDDRRYADIGVRVVREVLDRFVEEDENTILNYRCELGRFLFLAGRPEDGDAALQAVIRDCPHLAGGYVALADELTFEWNVPPDIPRAIALLEQALSHPVEDAADWDVEARLDDLRDRVS
jgi:hypothetical protein